MTSMVPTVANHHGHPGRAPASGRKFRPAALCLHCSTGSSRQWRSLAARLGEKRSIIAPDLLGYGNNPPWPRQRCLRLETEVARVVEHLPVAAGPVDVVAHSFGAAVAVKLALDHGEKVRTLTLYEPVLFALLQQDKGASGLVQIDALGGRIEHALTQRDTDTAARHFIDFWSGAGSWEHMPEARRRTVRGCIDKVRADFEALIADQTTLAQLARLQIPVLCLSGGRSPQVTRQITHLLSLNLPRVASKRFETAGHMGPLTHADEVNAHIDAFLSFPFTPRRGVDSDTFFSVRAA